MEVAGGAGGKCVCRWGIIKFLSPVGVGRTGRKISGENGGQDCKKFSASNEIYPPTQTHT